MATVALSLGSNIEPSVNIRQALTALRQQFGDVRVSPVFESEAVGFPGDNFLNLVAVIETDQSLPLLIDTLKSLEDRQGRDRSAPRFSGRTLDIDILTFDRLCGRHAGIELPRPEITAHAFVLWPLAELLPEVCHPLTGQTYAELWAGFKEKNRRHDKNSNGSNWQTDRNNDQSCHQRLWPVDFDWQDNSETGRATG